MQQQQQASTAPPAVAAAAAIGYKRNVDDYDYIVPTGGRHYEVPLLSALRRASDTACFPTLL